jgi:CubicO group peptidase (beta-lactamase class C family)
VAVVLAGCATTLSSDHDRADLADLVGSLDSLRTEHRIPGLSYAVVRDWKIADSGGLGVVNLDRGTPATSRTHYPIASLTKAMTGVLLFQLAEEGRLDPDAPMASLLADARFPQGPDLYLRGYAERCADIRALATHDEPGFDDYRYLFEDYRCDTEPLTVRHHLTHTAQGEPGTAYVYNGVLFALLGQVAEEVTGEDLATLFRRRLIRPLGLLGTSPGSPVGVAATYRARSHAVDPETGHRAPSAAPSGPARGSSRRLPTWRGS